MTFLLFRFPILLIALVLDAFLAEPESLWSRVTHPVIAMGRLIAWLELKLNRPGLTAGAKRQNGMTALAVMLGLGALIGLMLSGLVYLAPVFMVVEMMVVAILLAGGSLIEHLNRVLVALRKEDLPTARREVAKIVGRDVSAMEESDIVRAAIETSAENSSDGLIGPALAYLVFGLPGIIIYKFVNTADSMIGHKNEKLIDFGRASALADDGFNFVPARLSAWLIAAAAQILRLHGRRALSAAFADANKHASPNAGWPEAAVAGALGLSLGGPRRYGGTLVQLPSFFGEGRRNLVWLDLARAIALCRLTFVVFGLLVLLIGIVFFQLLL